MSKFNDIADNFVRNVMNDISYADFEYDYSNCTLDDLTMTCGTVDDFSLDGSPVIEDNVVYGDAEELTNYLEDLLAEHAKASVPDDLYEVVSDAVRFELGNTHTVRAYKADDEAMAFTTVSTTVLCGLIAERVTAKLKGGVA